MALIRFSSRAAGELFMLDRHAEPLFRLMGKEASAQGVLTAAQIPAALKALRAAVARDKAGTPTESGANPSANPVNEERDESGSDSAAEPIRLAQRAWPLIEMLERAERAGADVLWGV